jgi:cytidylate kinase
MNTMVPRIAEIIGPAGAGKTTLCHILRNCNGSIHLSNFPDVRKISAAPFFIFNGLQISSSLLGLSQRKSRKLTRREFAWLSILNGWPSVLKRELKENNIIILDQGPVYLLTETSEFGPDFLKRQTAEDFWRGLYSRWADILDMIIWLDAEDTDLLKRIRNRDKEHVVKTESVDTTFEFLARYRKAYERTISNLSVNHHGLKVFRFDTSQQTPDEIAKTLIFEFNST